MLLWRKCRKKGAHILTIYYITIIASSSVKILLALTRKASFTCLLRCLYLRCHKKTKALILVLLTVLMLALMLKLKSVLALRTLKAKSQSCYQKQSRNKETLELIDLREFLSKESRIIPPPPDLLK